MSRVMRGTPSGDAYLDLQNRARRTRRQTQELLQLYVLEGFLARLAASAMRERLVLKGGILLAAFGSRRPTRDVDLAGRDIANDTAAVLELVRTVLSIEPAVEDGIEMLWPMQLPRAVRDGTMPCDRSERAGRIPGSPPTFPSAGSSSTKTSGGSAKCSRT